MWEEQRIILQRAECNVRPPVLFGTHTAFPVSFYGSVHNANQAASYEDAVKAEILASGDNCSRVVFSGAYTAAR